MSKSASLRHAVVALAIPCLGTMMIGCGMSSKPGNSNGTQSGTLYPAGHSLIWTQQIENQTLLPTCPTSTSCSPTNQVNGIATDAEADTIIVGTTVTQLPDTQNVSINTNCFVAKYSLSGQLLWIVQFGPQTSFGFANVFSVSIDKQGNIFAGGYITGAFSGYMNPSAREDLMLVKIDPSGQIVFTQQYDTGLFLLNVTGGSVTVLPSGKVAFGWYSASNQPNSGNQSFIYVVDPDEVQAGMLVTYPGANELARLTSDSEGNLYAVGASLGAFPGIPNLAGTIQSPATPFVLKMNGSSGAILWQQTFGSYLAVADTTTALFSVSLDAMGNVIVGGGTTAAGEELCAGLCNISSVQDQSAFLTKLNGDSGALDWTKVITSGSGDGITGVTADQQGNIFGVGFTNGVLASGYSQPTQDFFAIKLEADGTPQWVQQFGAGPWKYSLLPTTGIQAATDVMGNLLVGGETQGAFPGMSNPTSLGEVFVEKFGP